MSALFPSPVLTSIGATMLHLSSSSLLALTGRPFGISGIVDGLLFASPSAPNQRWRLSAVAGLMAGPAVLAALGGVGVHILGDGVTGRSRVFWEGVGVGRVLLAGLLVGLGSRLGSGCTSGHFLCGSSRLSPRSLVASLTFTPIAMLTSLLFPLAISPLPPAPKSSPSALPALALLSVLYALHTLLSTYLTRPVSAPAHPAPTSLKRQLPYLLPSLTFSLGLLISGMFSPPTVLGFLHLPALLLSSSLSPRPLGIDPSLLLVVLFGVLPNSLHYFSHLKRNGKRALLGWETWRVPERKDVDWRLVGGAVVFGAGWGLAGICPGPAVVGLSQSVVDGMTGLGWGSLRGVGAFVSAMVVGMGVGRRI